VATLPPGYVVLSRAEILKAARTLVSEVGVGGMTMRVLGHRLKVQQGGIYRHMAGRDDILDGLADQVYAEVELPGPDVGDWGSRLHIGAMAIYDAFSALPGLGIHMLQRPQFPPSAIRVREWVVDVAMAGGLTGDEAIRVRRVFLIMSTGSHGLDSGGAALGRRRSAATAEEFDAAVERARTLYSDALGYVIDGLRAEMLARHA
jgi:AcrR family transcriptional regulator